MGRIEDLEGPGDEKKATGGSVSSKPTTQAGAEWVPNKERTPEGVSRTVGQFVRDKRHQGAAAPRSLRGTESTTTTSANANSNDATCNDAYSHLRPNGWRDQQRNHPTSNRNDGVRPQEAEIAYEVVATPVFDDEKRNPFKDWRVVMLICVVAVVVGVSVGVVASKETTKKVTGSFNATSASGQPQQPGGESGGTVITPVDAPALSPTMSPAEYGTDEGDVVATVPETERTDPPEASPAPAPVSTLKPTLPPTAPIALQPAPETTNPVPTLALEPELVESEQVSEPPELEAPININDPNDRPLPLVGCSRKGLPSVALNPFSIHMVTTYADAQMQLPGQKFVEVTFQYLFEFLKEIPGVAGYYFRYDFETLRRMLEEDKKRHLRSRSLQTSTTRGGDFNVRLEGCIDLRDASVVPPSYNDIQSAIEKAFSVGNLDVWLEKANAVDFRITSVNVLDGSGSLIGDAVP